MDAQPAKLLEDDDHEYLVELSRNFHSLVNDSPFYIKPVKTMVPSIERYNDILEQEAEAKQLKSKKWPREEQWAIDWERFPMELRPVSMRTKMLPESNKTIEGSSDEKTAIGKKGIAKKRVSTAKSSEADKKKRKLLVKDEEEEIDESTIQERLANLEKMEAQGSSLIREIKQESVEIDEDSGSGDEETEKKEKQKPDEEDNKASEDEEAGNEEDFEEEMGDYGDDYFDNGEEYGDDDDGDNEGPTY